MPTPFTKEDLERPSSEVRSLHDEVARFVRNFMGLETPLKQLPTSQDMYLAFMKTLRPNTKESERSIRFAEDLMASDAKNLWPGTDPPSTITGVAWRAAHDSKLQLEAEAMADVLKRCDEEKVNAWSSKAMGTRHGKSRRGGRKKGAKNYSKAEIELLIDVAEDLLPIGADQWEEAAVEFVRRSGKKNFYRDGNSLKTKFNAMMFKDKPTGVNAISVQDLRVQKIKLMMEKEQCIGKITLNSMLEESDDGDDKEDKEEDNDGVSRATSIMHKGTDRGTEIEGRSKTRKALDGTHIFDVAGLPPTKKRREDKMAYALSELGRQNVYAASKLATAVEKLQAEDTGNKNDSSSRFACRLDAMEKEIHELSSQQQHVAKSIDSIAEYIKSQKKPAAQKK